MHDPNLYRYQRQTLLPGIGKKGQQLLLNAKVLVVGAGGLGCPALQYLVAAGVGTVGIVDGDTVDISNLHRQPLYTSNDVGQLKAEIAKARLSALNEDCIIHAYPFYVHATNAFELFEAYDIIVDGSDNFATRYLVNDTCVLQKKPLVYGAVYRFEGQVAVFNCLQANGAYSAQYRDLFPNPADVPDCATAGVLGVLPGIIGAIQANEAIKLITHTGESSVNMLFTYNALNNQSFQLEFEPTATGRQAVPANRMALEARNYAIDCATSNVSIIAIDADKFEALITGNNISIIDVREPGEEPLLTDLIHQQIPLSVFDATALHSDNDIVLICQSGIRSREAAKRVAAINKTERKIYTLEGGIINWLDQFK